MIAPRAMLAAATLASGCDAPTPESVTWEDVRPILLANCVRCHGDPAARGAPDDFRLDRYGSTLRVDVGALGAADPVVDRGAQEMAPFVADRAAERADMPPDGPPLSDRQRDILRRWAEDGAPLGPASSAPPTLRLLDPPAVAEGAVTLRYELADPDGQVPAADLYLDEVGPATHLATAPHAGRGTLPWDASTAAAGPHRLLAVVADDHAAREIELARVEVRHGPSGAAPSLQVLAPVGGDIVIAGPGAITLEARDADGDPLEVSLAAVRGDQRVELADATLTEGGAASLAVDLAGLEPGTGWRLQATASDGQNERRHEVPVVVGDPASALGYADVAPILTARCRPCHAAYVEVPLDAGAIAAGWAGPIYRRAIRERTMPPPSAVTLVPGYQPPTAEELETLAEWLLAGAQP